MRYNYPLKTLSALLFTLLLPSLNCANPSTAPVSGYARSFILGTKIANAKITILETGQTLKTDAHGQFGPFQYPVGKPLTLLFKKWGYKTTQSGTVIVPKEGLTGTYHNITFQIPSIASFYFLDAVIGGKLESDKCHVVTTITAQGKTLEDEPQGEPYAQILITPHNQISEKPFYFDVFKRGPLKNKTNPFTRNLTFTSEDGGAGFFNLTPSDQPYTITAIKNGVRFSEVQFICRKDAFINISPPQGPHVQV